jgi:Na+/melibiose symporter-like transporter
MEETHRLGLRIQGFAVALCVLSLLGTGVLVWQHFATRHEHTPQTQALLTDTQTMTDQTQVLLEVLRQGQKP